MQNQKIDDLKNQTAENLNGDNELKTQSNASPNNLSIDEQIDLFAEIIVDLILKEQNEKN